MVVVVAAATGGLGLNNSHDLIRGHNDRVLDTGGLCDRRGRILRSCVYIIGAQAKRPRRC